MNDVPCGTPFSFFRQGYWPGDCPPNPRASAPPPPLSLSLSLSFFSSFGLEELVRLPSP